MFLGNETFKDMLEELEPDVHRYFPIGLFAKDHDPATGQPEDGFHDEPSGKTHKLIKVADCGLLNICNRLHSLTQIDPRLARPGSASI